MRLVEIFPFRSETEVTEILNDDIHSYNVTIYLLQQTEYVVMFDISKYHIIYHIII